MPRDTTKAGHPASRTCYPLQLPISTTPHPLMMFRLTHHLFYWGHLETRASTTHLSYSALWLLVFKRYPFRCLPPPCLAIHGPGLIPVLYLSQKHFTSAAGHFARLPNNLLPALQSIRCFMLQLWLSYVLPDLQTFANLPLPQ